ncbi:MAG: hypothetical protein IJ730_02720 [Alphaproteobacteria bacterium]|nr:hypothetical protein [Alphaproteobacteria bacterium]
MYKAIEYQMYHKSDFDLYKYTFKIVQGILPEEEDFYKDKDYCRNNLPNALKSIYEELINCKNSKRYETDIEYEGDFFHNYVNELLKSLSSRTLVSEEMFKPLAEQLIKWISKLPKDSLKKSIYFDI